MKLLAQIIASPTEMMALSSHILNLYLENLRLDDPVPNLDDGLADELNDILATVTPDCMVAPAYIVVDEIEDSVTDELNRWIESFVGLLNSSALPDVAKNGAREAFVNLVYSRSAYDEDLTPSENLRDVWWVLRNWQMLHPVCPQMSTVLHSLLGRGRCHHCNGCGDDHLYYDPDTDGYPYTTYLMCRDGTIFEEESWGKNLCQGESLYCKKEGTIMRCSEGQAYDQCHCCGHGICDRCWFPHRRLQQESDDEDEDDTL